MSLQKLRTGFAKIQGEDFEYFVQSYSIILGRNSKKAAVDLDLAGMGAAGANEADTEVAGRNISRSHARIYYDFQARCFMLEVFGKNGVTVNGAMKEAGAPPVPLRSQDLLQIADRKMYFLLPAPKRKQEQAQMNGGKRRRTKS